MNLVVIGYSVAPRRLYGLAQISQFGATSLNKQVTKIRAQNGGSGAYKRCACVP
jgi:hypothetical protein